MAFNNKYSNTGNTYSPYKLQQNNQNNTGNVASIFIKTITGICSMITEERFEIKPSGFHKQLIEVFKTMPTKSYDSKTRNWNFKLSDYEDLQLKLKLLRPEVTIGELPYYVLKTFRTAKANSKIDLSVIDEKLRKCLMAFQEEGVRFGIEKQGKCLIADEMGLGKTYQALAIASYYRRDWPLLICTTASVKNTWHEKVLELLPSVRTHEVVCLSTSKDYMSESKVLIITYSLMEKCLKQLKELRFGVLIMDESHTLKNNKAKCTQAGLALVSNAKRVILLTGTPALSRPNELYTQLHMLDSNFFLCFKEYSKRYCDGRETNFGWDSSGCSNLVELNLLLKRKFMIRRTKDQVITQLEDIEREAVLLDPKNIVLSEEIERDLSVMANNFMAKKATEKHAALLAYFSETAKFKINAVCMYIIELLEKVNKFLVFAHHKSMIDAICNELNKRKIEYIKIDGNIKPEDRTAYVEKYQNNPKYRVAVLSITAANAGITLTAAQTVIFAELHWTPSILAQAESRAHRIGQIGKVIVKYLIAKGTADDIMWPMLQNKQDILTEAGLCTDHYGDASTTNLASSSETKANIKEHFKPVNNKETATEHGAVVAEANDTSLFMDDDDDLFANMDLNF